MTLITAEMIWNEVQATKKMVSELLERKTVESIEEISLHKAAKLLRLGSETVIRHVERRELKARAYRDKNRVKRYRFRIADIKEFQERQSTPVVFEMPEFETDKEILDRLTRAANA